VVEQLTSFAPRRCVERGLLAPGAEPFTEVATTLFVDLAGFTPLTERLARLGSHGTEQLSWLLRHFFGAVTDLVLDHGGDPVAYGGDALTVVFDGPDASALAGAVRCAEEIHDLAGRTAGSPTLAGPVTLQTRIGVARGPVTTAVARSSRRSVPVHLGSGLDLAVEAESKAGTGEVFVHPSAAVADARRSRPTGSPCTVVSPTSATEGAVDPAELARLVHPLVLSRLRAGGALLESHRSVTVAFARFAPVHQEGLSDFLSVVGSMLDLVEHGGGEVVQVSGGDKGMVAMLLFGAPVARDDDPVRAAETMIELRQQQRLVSVGVATGPVFAALLGSERRRFSANSGPAVNLAARLMQAAPEGEILVDSSTWGPASAHLRARRPAVLLPVKGLERPAEVRSVAGWRRSRRGRVGSSPSPLVGRDKEIAAVERLLDGVSEGVGHTLCLHGEPGVGKTRLLREAAAHATTRGFKVVSVDAGDHPRGRSAGLWRDMLCALGVAPVRGGSRQWQEALTAAFPDVGEQVPAIARLLRIPMAASQLTRDMPSDIEEEVAQGLFARAVREAAASQPLVLLVEDAHHLDGPSVRLLGYLARALAGSKAGVLLTRRDSLQDDGDHGVQPGEQLRVLALAPEDAAQLAADVWAQAGGGSAPPWLPDAVARRAGGNPLLVRVVTHALKASWEPGQPPPTPGVAGASLAGLLSERVDRLPALQRQLLNALAVARRPLLCELAGKLAEPEMDALTANATARDLLASDLVLSDPLTPERYHLRHEIVQEVVYQQVSHVERVRLHRSLADHLAGMAADPLEVAEHVVHLDDPERARHWYPLAAASARASWAVDEAIGWWRRALPLMSGSGKAAAEVEMAELLLVGDRPQEVFALVDESTREFLSTAQLARLLHAEAEAALSCSALDRSSAAATQAISLFDGVDEGRRQRACELLVRALCEWGRTLEARASARVQLDRAEATGDSRAIATAHASLGMALLYADLAEEAAVHYEAARRGAASLGDVVLEVHVLSDLAGCCHARGDFATCVDLLAQARAAADRIGYRRHLAFNLTNEAQLRSSLGDTGAAACAALAVVRSLELGDTSTASNALYVWITSDPALMSSVSSWRRLVGVEVALGRRGFVAECGAQYALALARAGQGDGARRAANDATQAALALELPNVVRRTELARVLAAAGPKGSRSRKRVLMLLEGLSRLAADEMADELERAEIAVERWRATGSTGDHEAALGAVQDAFCAEPSAPVQAWLRELGAAPAAAPAQLPPPVGIGRISTTRAQLSVALTQLEAAAL
jgi:class 3 adenylate cyclase